MKLKIKLFGILADKAGTSEIEIETESKIDKDSLLKIIDKKYPAFGKTNYVIAVNKKITNENNAVNVSDEIAILPPFAGG
ncbi:MAG: MoaD/ThiS family protein [Ignavibacteriae bacterium]|nr:MoaD/ThiS family protein [Ignavibacteriota bacterium]